MVIQKNNIEHLPWLDGLRGIAALWVLLSHVQILSGFRTIPVLSWGSLAVDLFMMLSGFLMTHHYILRKNKEPWERLSTAGKFWLRRFFRIAPLYYVLLVIALFMGDYLGESRHSIAAVWPNTATDPERYFDQSIQNIIAHFTFYFGFSPTYSFRSPLPDWSIGLEMQFYLVFPLLMFLMYKFGPVKITFATLLGCLFLQNVFPGFFHQFQMPSFLLLKLYVFSIGIWIALARDDGEMKRGFSVALGIAIAYFVMDRSGLAFGRIVIVVLMFYLMDNGTMPASKYLTKVVEWARVTLSSRISVFLGETSYASYLVHLLFVIPIAGWLSTQTFYVELPGSVRFGLCLALTIPFIYFTSWVLFNKVEKRGIDIGKLAIKAFEKKKFSNANTFK